MQRQPVFGVVSFRDGIHPQSLFSQENVRKKIPEGKCQQQIVVNRERRAELVCMLRYPRGLELPSGLDQCPVPAEAFEAVSKNNKIVALFGVRLRPGHRWRVEHSVQASVLDDSFVLRKLAERVLKQHVRVLEIFKDLAGGVFAKAIVARSSPVYLFYRNLPAVFRGTSGWFIDLEGASHVDFYLDNHAAPPPPGFFQGHLFGVPINRIASGDIRWAN